MLTSVLIPCYNAEAYVGAAIESALAQDYPSTEVVVFDDGSTDGSLEVIRRYERHGNVRWETGPNRGGNAARNHLLELARGELVQWLDADDTLAPTKVSRLAPLLEQGHDVAFCDYAVQTPTGRRPMALSDPDGDPLCYFLSNSVITMLPLHRRADLIAVGGFDQSLKCCQEYELHLRLARSRWRSIGKVDEELCTKRSVADSVSSSDLRVYRQRIMIAEALHSELRRSEEITPQREAALAAVIYNAARHLIREGDTTGGRSAFRLARRVHSKSGLPTSAAMRLLTNVLGPVRAELLRSRLVRLQSPPPAESRTERQ